MKNICRNCGMGLSRHCTICRACPGDHMTFCPRHDDNRTHRGFAR